MSTFSAPASPTSGLAGYDLEGASGEKAKRTLYIKRRVRNGAEVVEWAKAAGFATTLPEDDMHVTIAYSKTAVDWDAMPRTDLPLLRLVGGDRKMKRLGKAGEAAVLGVESDDLTRRWGDIHAAGAVWGWPNFQPHITISYAADSVDMASIVPYGGVIELGPEEWAEVKANYMTTIVEKSAPAAAGVAIITDAGDCLMLRRSASSDFPGMWCFPGGGIEAGETAAIAAKRETLEEVGFVLPDNGSFKFVGRVITLDIDFTTFHQTVEEEFVPKLNDEHDLYRWLSLDDLPDDLHPWVRATMSLVISASTNFTVKAAAAALVKSADVTSAANEENTMNVMNLFIPITKVDAAQRLVYGIATAEKLDRSGEVCDYATTKPHYEKWSGDIEKVTGGKSLGNVRAMHGKVAAGKVTNINFNDDMKQIEICAKVVDDAEWKKVEEGVYTGFSQGGSYVKRWKDGDVQKYTASPSEVSLVDLPCLPESTFEVIKTDGTHELRKFVTTAATVVTNDMVAARATDLAKAAGDHFLAHIEEARTQLETEIAKSAPEIAAIIAETTEPVVVDTAVVAAAAVVAEDVGKVTGGDIAQVWVSDRIPGQQFAKKADLQKALIDLDAAESVAKAAAPVLEALKAAGVETAVTVVPSSSGQVDTKEKLVEAIKAFDPAKYNLVAKRDLIKAAIALSATDALPEGWIVKAALDTDELKKYASLDFVADLMYMLGCVQSLEHRAEYDAMVYGGVQIPKSVTDRFGAALVEMGNIAAEILDVVLVDTAAREAAEAATKAAPVMDLLKRGARNSTSDKSLIKQAHDAMATLDKDCCGMGKTVEGDLAKAATVEAENAALKAKDAAHTVMLSDITAGVQKMLADMELLKASNTELVAKNTAMEKDVSAIRATPLPSPAGSFRLAEKSIDINLENTISEEELRQRGTAAQFAHQHR